VEFVAPGAELRPTFSVCIQSSLSIAHWWSAPRPLAAALAKEVDMAAASGKTTQRKCFLGAKRVTVAMRPKMRALLRSAGDLASLQESEKD
jgi:hypothetical protein